MRGYFLKIFAIAIATLFLACITHESFAAEAQTQYDGSTMVVESSSVEVDMSVLEEEGESSAEPAEGEPLRFKNVGSDEGQYSSDDYYGTNKPDEDRYAKNGNEELEKIEREINQLEAETSSYSSHKDSSAIILKPKAPKLNFSQQRDSYFSKIYTPYRNSYSSTYGSSTGSYANKYSSPSYPSSKYSSDRYSSYINKYKNLSKGYSPYLSGSGAYRPRSQYLEGTGTGPAVQAHAVTEVEREVIKDSNDGKIKLTPPGEIKASEKAVETKTAEIPSQKDSTLSNLEATEKKLKALQEEIEREVARQKDLTKSLNENKTPLKAVQAPVQEKQVIAEKTDDKKQLKIIKEKGKVSKTTEKRKTINKEQAKKLEEKHMEDAYSAVSAEAEDEAALKARIEADIKAQAAAEAEARALAKKSDSEKKNTKGTTSPTPKDNMKAAVQDITKGAISTEAKESSDAVAEKTITAPISSEESSIVGKSFEPDAATPVTEEAQIEQSNNVYAQKAMESAGEKKKKKKLISIQENNSNLPIAEITKNAVTSEITNKAIEVSETIEEPSSSELVEVTAPTEGTKLADASADISKPALPTNTTETTPDISAPATSSLKPKETLTSIAFERDSSELSEKAKEELTGVVNVLKQSPDVRVQIQAFSFAKNKTKSDARRMSLSRGLVIRSYLTEKGIKPVRLDIRALGDNTDKIPVDRVDIVLLD